MGSSATNISIRISIVGLACLVLFLNLVACHSESRIEENAVVIDIRITPQQAKEGTVKLVRAPDKRVYNLIIPKDVKHLTPLRLPPKIAETYDYPLYFRVRIMEEGESPPDDLLNRKSNKKN